MSHIDPPTVRAYLETDYCMDAPEPFVLRIGAASGELARLYAELGKDCAAFISACNPYSHLIGEEANAKRQAELSRELQRLGLTFIGGSGRHPSGGWPAEPGYLVLGLALDGAKALGERYRQNAILWCGADAVPELILLR